jgi:ribose transport system substrate-binding protein
MKKITLHDSILIGLAATTIGVSIGRSEQANAGYTGASRAMLWSVAPIPYTDTTKYKKAPPYVIGFSNAGLGDSWRIVMLHSMQNAVSKHLDVIKKFYVTDANHNDSKQVSDIEDLVSRGVDLLIVSANTEQALDPAITRVMKRGIPVIMVDRRITSDNFVSFATAADAPMGRTMAQWLVEKLGGKGNIIILGGQAGSSPNEIRVRSAMEIFKQYPDIKILDTVYSDWSPAKAKSVMATVIQKYGKQINGVYSTHGLQDPGSIEAFVEAGYKSGEIPPHTAADINGALKLAIQYKVPMINFDYPPAMGGEAVEVALKTLAGLPVPKVDTINAQIAITKGDETASAKADLYIEDYVMPDKPSEYLLSSGLGRDYDPKTFKVKLP